MQTNSLRYSLRVRLNGEKTFFGPGISHLLQLVDQTGSLQTAAARMEMSYSKAWKIVRAAESELGFSLLERHVGGAGGGSSQLTEQCKTFIKQYDCFQQEIYTEADRLFLKYFGKEGADETD